MLIARILLLAEHNDYRHSNNKKGLNQYRSEFALVLMLELIFLWIHHQKNYLLMTKCVTDLLQVTEPYFLRLNASDYYMLAINYLNWLIDVFPQKFDRISRQLSYLALA